ncbi:type II 3-dehydroquinate dehydratase [Candidatus Vidania fulgoroideorum]
MDLTLNMLGIREKKIYGDKTLKDINTLIKKKFNNSFKLIFYQSNSENKLVKKIQNCYKKISFIIINPSGFSYNSYSIIDSILSIGVGYIEVHITNIFSRGNRKFSIFSKKARCVISGFGYFGYILALEYLKNILKN